MDSNLLSVIALLYKPTADINSMMHYKDSVAGTAAGLMHNASDGMHLPSVPLVQPLTPS